MTCLPALRVARFRFAPVALLVAVLAACSSTPVASPTSTPGGSATDPASASAATSPAPSVATPAPSAASTTSLEDFAGTWTFGSSNARIVSATGGHAGGNVVLQDDRYVFTAGEFRSQVPLPFKGTVDADCTATSCRFSGIPILELREFEGELAIVDGVMLTPIGRFGDQCAWSDIPDGGVLEILETADIGGRDVPTVVRFATGAAGGVGEKCDQGSHVVAWDVTATRAP